MRVKSEARDARRQDAREEPHAFRHGKAIVVSPMVNAGAPLLTAVIAMAVAGAMPGPFKMAGVALALLAALLLALQPEGAEVKA